MSAPPPGFGAPATSGPPPGFGQGPPPGFGTSADPIDKYATQYGVDPSYARKILGIETGGEADPNHAVSKSGARGRFQLMPGTFAEMAVGGDITDPDQNTHAGIKYLSQQLKKYGGDHAKAAGAYNAGPGAMDDYIAGKSHLTPETVAYMAHFQDAQHNHSEADFRDRNVAPPGFHPAPAPTSVAQSAFGAPPPGFGNTPVSGREQSHQVAQQAREHPISGGVPGQISDATTKAIDYASAGAVPIALVARDMHFQWQQAQKLSGKAREDFKKKVNSGVVDPEVRPNEAHFYKTFKTEDLKPENIHKLAEMSSVVGDGPGSYSDVIDSITKLGAGAPHNVQTPDKFGGVPLAIQSQSSGQPHTPDTPSAVGQAVTASKPLLNAAFDMAAQAGNPTGAVVRTAGAIAKPILTAAGDIAGKAAAVAAEKIGGTEAGAKLLSGLAQTEQGVAPFSGIRRAAQKQGIDPDLAEQSGRTFKNAPAVAKSNASSVVAMLYGGLKKEERIEVERLSEGLPAKLADPHGELMRRAQDVRDTYTRMTDDQVALDLMTPGRIFDPGQYSYRGGDVYAHRQIPEQLQAFQDEYRGGASRPISGSTINSPKTFANFDEASPYLNMEKYDPADQMLEYLTRRGTNVGRERTVREMRDMGLINDLVVLDPKTGNPIGVGAAGDAAAGRVASRNARYLSNQDAFNELNKQRAARGAAPLSWNDLAQMQKAVSQKQKFRNRSMESDVAAAETDRLARRAQAGADRTRQTVGNALKQQMDKRTADLDRVNKRIAEITDKMQQGDRAAAGKILATAMEQRDKIAMELDKMREHVQRTAEDVYGNMREPSPNAGLDKATEAYYDAIAEHGPGSPEAEAAFKATAGMGRVEEPRPDIYGPVVGKIQDIYKMAHDLPPGPARAAVLRSLTKIGKRGVKGPMQIADAVQANRLLKQIQKSFSRISEASNDSNTRRVMTELDKMSQQLERGIAQDDARLYARRNAAADPAQRAADAVNAGNKKAADRQKKLLDKYDFAKQSEPDVRAFNAAFKNAMQHRTTTEKERILGLSRNAARNAGERQEPFVTTGKDGEHNVAGGSPTLKFATARPEVVRFFLTQGASRPDAEGIGAFLDGMNGLYRMGVISNPVVHAGWNLGMHYLASGGSPAFFAHRLWRDPSEWGKVGSKTGAEWQEDAERWNAVIHPSEQHPIFGGSYAQNVLDKDEELGAKHAMNAGLTALWHQNQRIVFGDFETRYSVDLFRKFVEEDKMTPQAAGIKVRQSLGDYTNVSSSGIEGALNRMLFFYPWMKTAIPFWAKTLIQRPGFVAVPGIGIRRWDQTMGDPDVGNESPFAIDLGVNAAGGRGKLTYPGPQKWARDLLNFLLPKNGDTDPIGSRFDAAQQTIDSHLMPWGGGSIPGMVAGAVPWVETYGKGQKAQQPGGGNFTTLANRDLPADQQIGQIAQHYAGELPGANLVEGVAALAQRPQALAGATGGFTYDTASKGQQRRAGAIQSTLDKALAHARGIKNEAGRNAAIKAARNSYDAKMKAFERTTPSAAPAASGPPPGFGATP